MEMQFQLREGTQDRYVWRDVLILNEYHLPERFSPKDIIIDIGAHIGVFALACASRGAKHIHCYEPDQDNFSLLQDHMRNLATVNHMAVWKSGEAEELVFGGYAENYNACGFCTPKAVADEGHPSVASTGLDEIIEQVAGDKRVRLVKIDAEGSEYPILYSSKRLNQISQITGELHAIGATDDNCPHALVLYLAEQGFQVSLWRQTEYGRNRNATFLATRIHDSV